MTDRPTRRCPVCGSVGNFPCVYARHLATPKNQGEPIGDTWADHPSRPDHRNGGRRDA